MNSGSDTMKKVVIVSLAAMLQPAPLVITQQK